MKSIFALAVSAALASTGALAVCGELTNYDRRAFSWTVPQGDGQVTAYSGIHRSVDTMVGLAIQEAYGGANYKRSPFDLQNLNLEKYGAGIDFDPAVQRANPAATANALMDNIEKAHPGMPKLRRYDNEREMTDLANQIRNRGGRFHDSIGRGFKHFRNMMSSLR
jgi:hypothetical protein